MDIVLKEQYQNEVAPALMKSLKFENVMQVPRIQKVVVNMVLAKRWIMQKHWKVRLKI